MAPRKRPLRCPITELRVRTNGVIAVSITIDTEADHDTAWNKPTPLTFRSIGEGVANICAPLFRRHRVRPTYLVTSEVMDDAPSVAALARLDDVELGTHLHGEHGDFICCYPADDERARLGAITRQFADRFGRPPRVYRAGRYAASARTAAMLHELGYVADTSVTPGIRWVHEQRPDEVVDFSGAPVAPYHPAAGDLARPGDLPLWEIPVTIVSRPRMWNSAVTFFQRAMQRPAQAYPLWVRPSTASWPWLWWAIDQAVRRSRTERLTVINIMMHSMEVLAGTSPYSPTQAAADRIVRRLERLCAELSRVGARFFTLSELVAELDGVGGRASASAAGTTP